MSCLFGGSVVTGSTPLPVPALILVLFLPHNMSTRGQDEQLHASYTQAHTYASNTRAHTQTDCNSMVECIIDGSALKDLLLIL